MATEKRLIDVDVVIQSLKREIEQNQGENAEDIPLQKLIRRATLKLVQNFIDYLEKCPTVDAMEVVHGQWEQSGQCSHKPCRIKNTDRWTIYRCSECGYSAGRHHSYNYCPNCGAKMDGERRPNVQRNEN